MSEDHSTASVSKQDLALRVRLFTREHYVAALSWAFTFFASVRVLSYLPTLWAIQLARCPYRCSSTRTTCCGSRCATAQRLLKRPEFL